MMPIIKHFDPVMGIDIHIVAIPPVGPVPIPHPHIALVLDPMDYIPIIGATVLVGGIPRGTAGTSGKVIPHIPMGGPFVKPPMNEDEIFMGSATVLADGSPLSFTALPVLGCQDVGMISPIRL
ncbi:MAG TPA: PAAR domain-containing protein, partial [Cellvibrionaceae bacterium]|nr:PAAR domain-containing protein [Cellvibrionaceae bacterium]